MSRCVRNTCISENKQFSTSKPREVILSRCLCAIRGYTTAKGFLLIYSVTERKSLDYLDGVLAQIRRTKDESGNGTIPIVLAGNKSDLAERREVSSAEAAEWARERGIATCVEMSAKTRSNITETFQSLVKQVAEANGAGKKKKTRTAAAQCTVL